VYITIETEGEPQEDFCRRALAAAAAFAVPGTLALPIARSEVPEIWHGLVSGDT